MATEKTWPVNVGKDQHDQLLELQAKYKEVFGFEVTHRAIVQLAIKDFHAKTFKATTPTVEVNPDADPV